MADEATTEVTESTTLAVTATGDQETGQPAELGEAGKKALADERSRARAAEKKAKALESQIEELQRAQMNDVERAIAEARAETRTEVLGQVGTKVAAAEFKAAAAGRLDDDQVSTLLAGLDLKAFLTDDGDVDASKVGQFIDGLAPSTQADQPADLGQGARSTIPLGSDPLLGSLKESLGIR